MLRKRHPPRYCSFCGSTAMEALPAETAFFCRRCEQTTYMASKPSVCAVVLDRSGHVLLVTTVPHPLSWDLPGGFLLSGESPEDGLRRELQEEIHAVVVGSKLVHAALDDYAGQRGHSLNLFYRVTLAANAVSPGAEVQDCRWFPLDRLPRLRFRSTREILLRLWRAKLGRRKR